MLFPIGKVVRLRSGGPLMTVIEVDETQASVNCLHFVERLPGSWDTAQINNLPVAALVAAEEGEETW